VGRPVAAGPLRVGTGPGAAERADRRVLGHGDPNLANFLWDGSQLRLVDFEDSGPGDRAFELALLTEHLSAWLDSGLETDDFLSCST
jgi:aminoglycoside phosphotransferase (APT) family kinase protein